MLFFCTGATGFPTRLGIGATDALLASLFGADEVIGNTADNGQQNEYENSVFHSLVLTKGSM